jgi:hypothetical protein
MELYQYVNDTADKFSTDDKLYWRQRFVLTANRDKSVISPAGRRYHRFVPFNFLLSLAAPHLHGVLAINLSPVSLSPAIPVLREFSKIETAPMKNLGASGTIIYGKNLKSKISCQTPFKQNNFKKLHIFLLTSIQPLTKKAGSGSASQWYGSTTHAIYVEGLTFHC